MLLASLCLAEDAYHPPARGEAGRIVSLAGTWSLVLDPERVGERQRWYAEDIETDTIPIPGTLDEHGKGPLNLQRLTGSLTRIRNYSGPAWYQTRFELPEGWRGRRVLLAIERTKASTVWIDDRRIGSQTGLVAEQVFDLGAGLAAGPHRLTIRVDNSDRPPVGDPHQLSDSTQTNWNGLLGNVELRAHDAVWIGRIRAVPELAGRQVAVEIEIGGDPPEAARGGRIHLQARPWNFDGAGALPQPAMEAAFVGDDKVLRIVLPLGSEARTWSEFSPALYRLGVRLITSDGVATDYRELDFGLREFTTVGSQFAINGKKVMLRGKNDACVFPLTGYAPMEVAEWVRILRIAKDWGINHYRFHTWCPPQAAFAAADMVGIYLQPELPIWGALSEPPPGSEGDVELRRARGNAIARNEYLKDEGRSLMRAYANHASFVMFAIGNELSGDRSAMRALLDEIRKVDDRPLCAEGSNNFLWAPSLAPGDDFWTTNQTGGHYKAGCYFPDGRDKAVRGSFAVHTKGHVNNRHPSTDFDYSSAIAGIPVPVIGHETGQYQVYPNFDEIAKYTGVLAPRNFEMYRERLKQAGMAEQWRDFFRASGALSVICYREEIESALRTPGFGGFQLLDLQDYPGQGTALVGMLDAFMDSKNLITPARWREFCSATVPLLRMPKYDWTQGESFHAAVGIAHYGPESLTGAAMHWQLVDDSGKRWLGGSLAAADIVQGKLTGLGEIAFPLNGFRDAKALTLILELPGTAIRNRYRFWVYPDEVRQNIAPGVLVTRSFNQSTIQALQAGRRVLLFADSTSLARSVPGAFQSDFWCYPMFKKYNPPGTLGLLIDDAHPALARFPTGTHSDWQWYPVVRHGCAMILDDVPKEFRPFVQVIDNFDRNHKLALAFEARVGEGRLLACSGAIFTQPDQPACRQLLASLLSYVGSDDFLPSQELSLETLSKVLGAPVQPDE